MFYLFPTPNMRKREPKIGQENYSVACLQPTKVLPDITNLQREDLTDLKNRLSQVEQVLKLGPPASSEVLKLRGRMQTVESELVDVRAELKEVRMAVSRFATEPGEGAKPGPIRACHGVASPAMPSPKQAVRSDVRRPSDGTPGQAL
eukprot:symbB.v1.2.020413.t1/scaffold1712.1/size105033/7